MFDLVGEAGREFSLIPAAANAGVYTTHLPDLDQTLKSPNENHATAYQSAPVPAREQQMPLPKLPHLDFGECLQQVGTVPSSPPSGAARTLWDECLFDSH